MWHVFVAVIRQKAWDEISLIIFVTHQILFVVISTWSVFKFDIRKASCGAILLEQVL